MMLQFSIFKSEHHKSAKAQNFHIFTLREISSVTMIQNIARFLPQSPSSEPAYSYLGIDQYNRI